MYSTPPAPKWAARSIGKPQEFDMTVATFIQPNRATQNGTEYTSNIDAAIAAVAESAGQFLPHEAATPNMTVVVDAGLIRGLISSIQVAQITSGVISAPTTNPRIDLICLHYITLTLVIYTGTEAASPVIPKCSTKDMPICSVALSVGQTSILNSHITDLRVTDSLRRGGDIGNTITMVPPTTTGTATAYLVAGYHDGYDTNRVYECVMHASNTGAFTMDWSGSGIAIGAKNVKLLNGNNPYPGAARINQRHYYRYDGTNLILLNPEKAFRGCLIYPSANTDITTPNFPVISFDTEIYDTDGLHDPGTPTLITIQNDGYVELIAMLGLSLGGVGTVNAYIAKNGVNNYMGGSPGNFVVYCAGAIDHPFIRTGVIPVVAGDYFTLNVQSTTAGTSNLLGNTTVNHTWLQLIIHQ
jgi:hypothetical protein